MGEMFNILCHLGNANQNCMTWMWPQESNEADGKKILNLLFCILTKKFTL